MGLFTGNKFKEDSSLILNLDSFDHRSRNPDDLTVWTDIVSGTSFPLFEDAGGTLDLFRKGFTSSYGTNKLLSTGINVTPFKDLDSTGWTMEFIFKPYYLVGTYVWFAMTSTTDIDHTLIFYMVNTSMPALQISGDMVLNDTSGENGIVASIFPFFFETININQWNYLSFSYNASTKTLLTQVNERANYGRANVQDGVGAFKTGWYYTIPNYISLDFSTLDTFKFHLTGPMDNRGEMNMMRIYSRGLSVAELQQNWYAASNRIKILNNL